MVTGSRQSQQRQTFIKANYVTSSPVVLAYALAGNTLLDLEHDRLGFGFEKVSVRDLWPSRAEIETIEDEIIKKILDHVHDKIQVRRCISRPAMRSSLFVNYLLDGKSAMELVGNNLRAMRTDNIRGPTNRPTSLGLRSSMR